MIYYPDEKSTQSWATLPLSLLGYERDPSKLQLLIRKAYEEVTRYGLSLIFYQQL